MRRRTVVKEVIVEDVVVLIVGVARRAAGHHSHCELLCSAIMRVVTGLKLRPAVRCSNVGTQSVWTGSSFMPA